MRTFRVVRGRPGLISIGEAASTYPPTGVGDDEGFVDSNEVLDGEAVVRSGGGGDVDGRDRDGDEGDDGFFCFFFAMITPAKRAIGSVCAA